MAKVAEASISELGSRWGVPGNQLRTGVTATKPYGNLDGELRIRKFYRYNWKAVYRPKSPKLADSIATLMEGAVKNWRYFGYSNYNAEFPREGVFDALMEMDEPDTRLCTTLANCDCASLLGASCYFSGVYEPKLRIMNTASEDAILMGTGEFIKLTDSVLLTTGKGLQRGDILLYRQDAGHTCVVVEGDDSEVLVPYYTADCVSVNIRSGPSTDYEVLETVGSGVRLWAVSFAANGWAQIKIGGTYGYISDKFIKRYPKVDAVGQTWLRKTPQIKDGNEIIVIPKNCNDCYFLGEVKKDGSRLWIECAYAGNAGWASNKYIKI